MVEIFDSHIGLFLPAHKGDAFFDRNCLIIHCSSEKAFELFTHYLTSFMTWLCTFFLKSIGGQSTHAGGATALAEHQQNLSGLYSASTAQYRDP